MFPDGAKAFGRGLSGMGVKAGSKPRDDVRHGELDDAIFAASFGKLIRNEGPDIYKKPGPFFQNTHPTAALSKLCRDVFGRLASPTEGGAVLRLSTGFGGGKTHALMTLWHLAQNIGDPTMGTDLLPPAGRPKSVRVVGIDAEGAGYPIFARHGDQEARSLAAELAFQFGGASALNAFGPANSAAASPDAATVEAMLPNEPVLILLDELVLYMAKLTAQEVGNLIGFLRTLMTAVVTRKQAVLVITDPKDQPADAENAARLEHLARMIEQQTGRQATVIEPIGDETAQVIIRRLFDSVDPAAAAKASADYHALYQRVAEDHPNLVPEEARSPKYAERIRICYPLHPRLLKTAEERLRVLPDYNLSRGTLRLFARVIRGVWEDPTRDPDLITAGEIDWSSRPIQTDLLERLDREKFRAAVSADVVGHARELDQADWGAHRRVASALLLESLPLEANSGLAPADLTLAVLRPDEAGTEPAEALDRLAGACWHLYPMSGSANAWQFRYEPNILKQIEERMGQVQRPDALDRLKTEVQKSFQGAFARLLPWPPNAKAVPERPELQLALCESEDIAKSVVTYSDDTPGAQIIRTYRNAMLAVAPDASGLEKAIQRIQRLKAAEDIEDETPNSEAGKLAREQLKKQKPELIKAARLEAARAFNRLVLADGGVLTIDERFIAPPDTSPLQLPSGQDAVRAFVEDRKLIYGPQDSLHPDYFIERVFSGAVPVADTPDARTTAGLQKRFLGAQGLKLVSDPSVIRASILRAVTEGRLVVRLEDGTAFDKDGAVATSNGIRQRDPGRKLNTLPMDEATLVAEAGSTAAQDWLKTTKGMGEKPMTPGSLPLPPPPPKGSGPMTATDIAVACQLADKRRLLSLRITCLSAADAQKILGAASPLGASSVHIEAELTGDLKDGGKLSFSVAEAKVSAAIKPLTMAQTLGNALVPGSSIRVSVVLGFGPDGKADLGALLRTLEMQLPDTSSIEARFAPLSDTVSAG
ncbi:hypothetical protein FHS88_000716 [Roseomonas alkaliterrae]|uniref:DUF499 domain-containing protein n=1 Tax=Neoroseomonas alkaliterrae TaxID=1452450 RepID=A0A840XP75_9PROT|nr:DUF499 domain-containing protein [Neoroseomonas alkaliterrae]MBB5688600.1 hypothetical protein [Neoroseomonas alkaliterrae]